MPLPGCVRVSANGGCHDSTRGAELVAACSHVQVGELLATSVLPLRPVLTPLKLGGLLQGRVLPESVGVCFRLPGTLPSSRVVYALRMKENGYLINLCGRGVGQLDKHCRHAVFPFPQSRPSPHALERN